MNEIYEGMEYLDLVLLCDRYRREECDNVRLEYWEWRELLDVIVRDNKGLESEVLSMVISNELFLFQGIEFGTVEEIGEIDFDRVDVKIGENVKGWWGASMKFEKGGEFFKDDDGDVYEIKFNGAEWVKSFNEAAKSMEELRDLFANLNMDKDEV